MGDKTKEIMLKVLLAKGLCITRESEYGDFKDYEKTKELMKKEIDFDRSSEPVTDVDSRFVGTYVDPERYKYLKAEIAFKGGKSYLFKLEFEDIEFSELINFILEFK